MFMNCDMIEPFICFFRDFLCRFMHCNFWDSACIFGFVFILRLILKTYKVGPHNRLSVVLLEWWILIEFFLKIALGEWLNFSFISICISFCISLTNLTFNEGTPTGCFDVIEGSIRVFHFFFHGFSVFLFNRIDFVV